MQTIRRFAPAKINLYLHVTGKREDGYHLLDSLVAFAGGIGDWVTITPTTTFACQITGPQAAGLTEDENNLVVRAARALATATGRDLQCQITLEKHLPLASGIGGGSSDAAATLLALIDFWQLDAATLPLEAIARQLGQDVVACLYRQTCAFRGIGDVIALTPPLPAAALVLVNPQVQVPTPAVFKHRQGAFTPAAPLEPFPTDLPALITQLRTRHNDLFAPATTLAPIIGTCQAALAATADCLFAAMSGSGATCFGLYATTEQATRATATLQTAHPTWWIASGRLPFVETIESLHSL